jgi:parallel beta-helix repeat protein
MKNEGLLYLFGALALSSVLGLALLWGLSEPSTIRAAPDTLYVSEADPTCSGHAPCYSTIQDAVDNAFDGDVIRVAEGTYDDVHAQGSLTQVVHIDKNVTIRGGYSADFATWDPIDHPTTLDARKQGRVIYISLSRAPTLEGLRITNGSNNGSGGGLYALSADPTIRECLVFNNVATGGHGGGISLLYSEGATLSDNAIFSNTTAWSGGGLYIVGNISPTMTGNEIYSNTAGWSGGGLYLKDSEGVRLTRNAIFLNTNGGILLDGNQDAMLENNHVFRNTKEGGGGGVSFVDSQNIAMINNIVVENEITGGGIGAPGIQAHSSEVQLLHTTIARNTGGGGQGVYVQEGATLWLTNTILVSHTVGIEVNGAISPASAILATTLWGDGAWANEDDVVAINGGTVFTDTDVRGDPVFLDPDAGDYHITGASTARDRAADTGIDADIDGDARPFGAQSDIGADEVTCLVRMGGAYYRSLQAAVDASASNHDVVQIAGTCRGVVEHNFVAYITKTLTVRGGYNGEFSEWDPQAYPTILDAQGEGGVIYIRKVSVEITPTLEALHLTNGSTGTGGGVNVMDSHPIISGCHIFSNTASGMGGGVYIYNGDNARLTDSSIYSNATTGGMHFGGGVFFYDTEDATLENTIVADNQIGESGNGAGIWIGSSSARFLHTTLACNSGGPGQGIYANGSTVELTNTILVSHAVGLETVSGATAVLSATLWGDGAWANVIDTMGASISTGTLNWWGDPDFVAPSSADYHIGPKSVALDRGLPTQLSTDIDGQARAVGLAPDLGADEGGCVIYVPLVLRDE